MGFVGERAAEVQWQLRLAKDVFNFSRGLFFKGASGAQHALLLELQAQSKGPGPSSRPGPRHMRLLHCTCIHPDFVEIASKPRYWQGPEQGADVRDVPVPPRG